MCGLFWLCSCGHSAMEEQELIGRDPCRGHLDMVPIRCGRIQHSNAPLPHCTRWNASALHLVQCRTSLRQVILPYCLKFHNPISSNKDDALTALNSDLYQSCLFSYWSKLTTRDLQGQSTDPRSHRFWTCLQGNCTDHPFQTGALCISPIWHCVREGSEEVPCGT